MNLLRKIFIVQVILVLVTATILYLWGSTLWLGFLAGGIFITINFVLGAAAWKRIWDKKPVAWTIILLVSKYAILITVLYLLVTKYELPVGALLTGVSTLGGSFLIAMVGKIERA